MKLSELLQGTEFKSRDGGISGDIAVRGIAADSRRVNPGDLFIAIRGGHADGSIHINDAAKAGAVAAICDREPEGLTAIPVFTVENARESCADICDRFYGSPSSKMKFIGITGTNGKSSTACILHRIISAAGYKTGLVGTIFSKIGDEIYDETEEKDDSRFATMTTPDPEILYRLLGRMADAGVEYVIMEVSSHALALGRVHPLNFIAGIFTNLSPEHLDFHGSMEAYFSVKMTLFRKCAVSLFCTDDPWCRKGYEMHTGKKISCSSLSGSADYTASAVQYNGTDGCEYTLTCRDAVIRMKSPIPGKFTVPNTLAAAACALECGIPARTVKDTAALPGGVDGRLERVKLPGGKRDYSVFIDYAHTPAALESLLQSVRALRHEGQRIVTLFGCGGDRDKSKRAPMGAAASALSDKIIVTSDNSRTEDPDAIIRQILQGVGEGCDCTVIKDRREAITYAVKTALPGDIILLVGKGHENYEINAAGKHPFSEKEIVAAASEL